MTFYDLISVTQPGFNDAILHHTASTNIYISMIFDNMLFTS